MIRSNILQVNRRDEHHRAMFFDCIRTVFDWANFETWHDLGYWSGRYVPYSVVVNDRIVANVSVSMMDLILGGKDTRAAQIGTVATLPEFRGRGYSRLLMEHIFEKYRDSVDTFILYANETVLEFYTRFGFEPRTDSIFVTNDIPVGGESEARPLNIKSVEDRAIVAHLLTNRMPLTKRFGARNYEFVFYWHWINSFPQNLLYLKDADLIGIITQKNGILKVWDIITAQPITTHEVIPRLIGTSGISTIEYYFPPDVHPFEYDEVVPCEGSGLFVRGSFETGKQPFKLPVTAET